VPIALVVHGGAWNIPDDLVEPARDGVRRALEAGWKELSDGATALDTVERVVRVLENDPQFDAGRGSHLNRSGKVEMDASIMDGSLLRAGAVAAIQRVRHPISVARRVMEESPHALLVGAGARAFAVEAGSELCRTRDLLLGRERQRYLRVRAGEHDLVHKEFDPDPPTDPHSMGTVGAVALDGNGRLAAATSTGGTQDKLPGRVGDTPIIGAGTYADGRVGSASATGWGEGILRVVLTKNAVDNMAAGLAPTDAGLRALANLDRVQGKAGLILVDRWGRTSAVFTTPRMARGWSTPDGELRVAIDPGEGER
jgi:beta-aspartyl-peptidase (threonine type)